MRLKARRVSAIVLALVGILVWLYLNPVSYDTIFTPVEETEASDGLEAEDGSLAIDILNKR